MVPAACRGFADYGGGRRSRAERKFRRMSVFGVVAGTILVVAIILAFWLLASFIEDVKRVARRRSRRGRQRSSAGTACRSRGSRRRRSPCRRRTGPEGRGARG